MFSILLILSLLKALQATYVISVYGDVYEDKDFFTRTYPWIIDNIGGDLTVDYYLLGSGRYSVPQMCVMEELKFNTFLQAQYLKCESKGTPSEICLCNTGIDREKFKNCVHRKGFLASAASLKYSQLRLDTTPVVEMGPKNTVFGVEDTWYLKKICTIFGDNMPRGCVKPFTCNNTIVETNDHRAIADFNCKCNFESDSAAFCDSFCKSTTTLSPVASTAPSTSMTTSEYYV